jgi:NAD(P)-dependent dehydrogenase (short-subunit alcohol dehydrogenase family)
MKRFEETLHDKQVVILGGSSGPGLETVRLAHAQGAKLVLIGCNEHIGFFAATVPAGS